MALEAIGKIIQIQPEESGTGKNGVWVKQQIVIETNEQYPKKICLALWGDKVAQAKEYKIGQSLKIIAAVESREYNGKWYTDVKPFRIDLDSNNSNDISKPPVGNSELDEFDIMTPDSNSLTDDLPF